MGAASCEVSLSLIPPSDDAGSFIHLVDQTQIPVSAVLHPPLPDNNLYFMSIMRIHQVKHGPFHEHSSQLHSIATGVPNWGKVNSGLFKMYEVYGSVPFSHSSH